ncbi:hypothetical protein RvY_18532-2 [Ramazzottius varieornatus]|uniref:Tudor-knot domain-containing protein n=1 Tax=Ramazzottius varieornatus TaxID=947166 RepID=A0A1D1WBC5_RAMVA|nr:hypothetical protein RvY_18532-2 [Ramazzottius varieornatus]
MEDDTNMRLEDFAQSFATGQVVWAINKGWHKAKFIAMETDKYPGDHSFPVPVYKVHYLRFGKRYDEWMFGDSIVLVGPENDTKAAAKNEAFVKTTVTKRMRKKATKKGETGKPLLLYIPRKPFQKFRMCVKIRCWTVALMVLLQIWQRSKSVRNMFKKIAAMMGDW